MAISLGRLTLFSDKPICSTALPSALALVICYIALDNDINDHSEDHHEDPIRIPFNPKNSQSFPLKSHLPSGKLT